MGTLTIRNLDDDIQRRLKQQAAAHDRSMEAEARAILGSAVMGGDFSTAWLRLADQFGGVELPVPERAEPREVEVG